VRREPAAENGTGVGRKSQVETSQNNTEEHIWRGGSYSRRSSTHCSIPDGKLPALISRPPLSQAAKKRVGRDILSLTFSHHTQFSLTPLTFPFPLKERERRVSAFCTFSRYEMGQRGKKGQGTRRRMPK